jgi:hypothetical protein
VNGWKKIGDVKNTKEIESTLRWRFGGMSESWWEGNRPILIDIDDLVENEDFPRILDYINTEVDKQRKGLGGHER